MEREVGSGKGCWGIAGEKGEVKVENFVREVWQQVEGYVREKVGKEVGWEVGSYKAKQEGKWKKIFGREVKENTKGSGNNAGRDFDGRVVTDKWNGKSWATNSILRSYGNDVAT